MRRGGTEGQEAVQADCWWWAPLEQSRRVRRMSSCRDGKAVPSRGLAVEKYMISGESGQGDSRLLCEGSGNSPP